MATLLGFKAIQSWSTHFHCIAEIICKQSGLLSIALVEGSDPYVMFGRQGFCLQNVHLFD